MKEEWMAIKVRNKIIPSLLRKIFRITGVTQVYFINADNKTYLSTRSNDRLNTFML